MSIIITAADPVTAANRIVSATKDASVHINLVADPILPATHIYRIGERFILSANQNHDRIEATEASLLHALAITDYATF